MRPRAAGMLGEAGASFAASGRSMMKTHPSSGILRMWMSPPCALTAFRAFESPGRGRSGHVRARSDNALALRGDFMGIVSHD